MQIIDERSDRRLSGCHPDLQRVVRRAYTLFPDDGTKVIITCGQRTLEQQKVLVANGFSRTMKSRHIPDGRGFSHAVDFAVKLNGALRWDWPPFTKIAKLMKQAAREENVPIEWGGDWKSFKDGPHFQLPWRQYPAKGTGLGLLTVPDDDEPEPKSDIVGSQEAAQAALGTFEKPFNLNGLWGLISSGGAGSLALLSGWDWRAMLVVFAFVSVWLALALWLYRDRVRAMLGAGDAH